MRIIISLLLFFLAPFANAAQSGSAGLSVPGLRNPVRPLGQAEPSAKDTGALRDIAERVRGSARPGPEPTPAMIRQEINDLESYLVNFPDSPYNPDLRRQLGDYYRRTGRYGKALEKWREAWANTRLLKEGFERQGSGLPGQSIGKSGTG